MGPIFNPLLLQRICGIIVFQYGLISRGSRQKSEQEKPNDAKRKREPGEDTLFSLSPLLGGVIRAIPV